MHGCISGRVLVCIPDRWWPVPLGGGHILEKLDARSVLDHRLDQLLRLGCAGRNRWFAGQRAYSRRHLVDAPSEFFIDDSDQCMDF